MISDNVGNITSVIDSQRNIINSYAYSPFGELIVEQEQVKLNIGFNTKYEDDSGLIYYNNRYYDSELGRFISQDPIFEEGGVNLYNFVENAPINHWDILGFFEIKIQINETIRGNWTDFGTHWIFGTGNKLSQTITINTDNFANPLNSFEVGVSNILGMQLRGTDSAIVNYEGITSLGHRSYRATGNALNGLGFGPEINYDIYYYRWIL